MVKPTKEQIDKMNYKKPITSYEAITADKPKTSEMYMGLTASEGYDNQTPNVNFADDKSKYQKNSDKSTLSSGGN